MSVTAGPWINRHGRSTWRVSWKENGRQVQKYGFATREDAEEWFAQNVAIHFATASEITLNQFAAFYLERWEVDKRPNTITKVHAWLRSALEAFGDVPLSELNAVDIGAWQMRQSTPVWRHSSMRALTQVLNAAVRWGYLSHNPATAVGPNPAPRPRELQPFTGDEITAILWQLRPMDAAITIFAVETGLRTSEWCGAEWTDLDYRSPAIRVMRGWSRSKLIPYPKTGHRRVPLTPRAQEALSWVLPDNFEKREDRGRPMLPMIFHYRTNHIDIARWANSWLAALKRAGVEHRPPYHLRHTFATNALERGVSVYDLARVMGTSVAMVEKHYGGWTQESEPRIRDLLSQ